MDDWNRNRTPQPDRAGSKRDEKHRDSERRGREATRNERLENALDRGLEESFPGSDPVSVTQPPHSIYDKNDAQNR